MKTQQIYLIRLLIFLVGLSSGWFIGVSDKSETRSSTKRQSHVSNRSRMPPVQVDHEPSPRMQRLANDSQILGEELETLDMKELETLIGLISTNVSIEGIGAEERQQIDDLLARMYELDPQQTVAWLSSMPHANNRRVFFRTVLDLATKKDPSQALALAENFRSSTGDALLLPDNLAQGLVSLGPDALLRALALTVGDADENASLPTDYPSGFDFKKVVEGMAKISEGLTGDQNLYASTSDLLAGWLTQDAQAAYDWFVTAPENQKKIVGGVTGFFEGYANVSEPADYGRFAAQVTLVGEPSDQSWADATSILMNHHDSSSLDSFLAEASSYQDSAFVFRKLLEESNSYSGGDFDRMRRTLFQQAPTDIQKEYLASAPEEIRKSLGKP